MAILTAIIGFGTVVCNLLILWIIIKLYTEFMKLINFNLKKNKDIKP